MNWIDAKRWMPVSDLFVLVYVKPNQMYILKRKKDYLWYDAYGDVECGDMAIEYWMPLPEPPEDGV